MPRKDDSFKAWLQGRVAGLLPSSGAFVIWCDPDVHWVELLREASQSNAFELLEARQGIEPATELELRHRLWSAKGKSKVVWVPLARHDLSWLKVFELSATHVWSASLADALREFGVNIRQSEEADLRSLLPQQARLWFAEPKQVWYGLSAAVAKGALVTDARVLEVLAGGPGEFKELRDRDHFTVFARRVIDDYGLPDPETKDEHSWRTEAAARLLVTEAAKESPRSPPRDSERVIPAGHARSAALGLLRTWQDSVRFQDSFERVVQEADKVAGLSFWARNLDSAPTRPLASRVVEETLFAALTNKLEQVEEVDRLAEELAARGASARDRVGGYWAQRASNPVGWKKLVELADVADQFVECRGAPATWTSAQEAITWYAERGWRLDKSAETLFVETPDLPAGLIRVRQRLRSAYLRLTDTVGRRFSELLSRDPDTLAKLPSAGEHVLAELEREKVPTALVVLDACRLELGHRLRDELDGAQRTAVEWAIAPIPSVTALGMAYALPVRRSELSVSIDPGGTGFSVSVAGSTGNLAVAAERRAFLKKQFGAVKSISIAEVLAADGVVPAVPTRGPRLLHVEGAEFDHDGHEGSLELTGASEHIDRYARAVRRLRDAGWRRVIVTTDHGYFHWNPDKDEVEAKPAGDVLWSSRRAVVGTNLRDTAGVLLRVSGAKDLLVSVPRSVNAYRTYGGMGYFHGGALPQEVVVPVVIATWPARSAKVGVVLKAVGQITSETPKFEVQAAFTGQGGMFPESGQLSRAVVVKVKEPTSGKLVFRQAGQTLVEPSADPAVVQLEVVEPRPRVSYGTVLRVEVVDADNEEMLAHEEITLKVDIDEW